jgi:hypothetical protein
MLVTASFLFQNLKGNTQVTGSKICIDTTMARLVMADAKKVPALQAQISAITIELAVTNERIRVKDSIIIELKAIEAGDAETIELLEAQVRDEKLIAEEYKKIIAIGDKQLNRAIRRERFWKGTAGAIAAGAAYLYFTK